MITHLLTSDEPASYRGASSACRRRRCAVHARTRTPAGRREWPRRTLPLAARYANIWNGQLLTPAEFRARSVLLDELLHGVDRQPSDVKRTYTTPVACGRDAAERAQRVRVWQEGLVAWAAWTPEDMFAMIWDQMKGIVGPPEDVVEQIQAYGSAGVEDRCSQSRCCRTSKLRRVAAKRAAYDGSRDGFVSPAPRPPWYTPSTRGSLRARGAVTGVTVMPTTYILPDLDWADLLGPILRDARPGAIVVVYTAAMRAHVEQVARAAGRDDLVIRQVEPPRSAQVA